jgi:hypothetical protein
MFSLLAAPHFLPLTHHAGRGAFSSD